MNETRKKKHKKFVTKIDWNMIPIGIVIESKFSNKNLQVNHIDDIYID